MDFGEFGAIRAAGRDANERDENQMIIDYLKAQLESHNTEHAKEILRGIVTPWEQ